MALIDYGAVLIKNGMVMNENEMFMDMENSVGCKIDGMDGQYFVYAGDSELIVAAYKMVLRVASNGELGPMWFTLARDDEMYTDRKVRHEYYKGVHLIIKEVWHGVYHAKFTYKGDFYNIIYGHGIDPDFKVWDKVKVIYLGKKGARKVDNLYKRLINPRMNFNIFYGKLRKSIDIVDRADYCNSIEYFSPIKYYIASTTKRAELINKKINTVND